MLSESTETATNKSSSHPCGKLYGNCASLKYLTDTIRSNVTAPTSYRPRRLAVGDSVPSVIQVEDNEEVDDNYNLDGLQNIDFRILRRKRQTRQGIKDTVARQTHLQYDPLNSHAQLMDVLNSEADFEVLIACSDGISSEMSVSVDAPPFFLMVDDGVWQNTTIRNLHQEHKEKSVLFSTWVLRAHSLRPGQKYRFSFHLFHPAVEFTVILVQTFPRTIPAHNVRSVTQQSEPQQERVGQLNSIPPTTDLRKRMIPSMAARRPYAYASERKTPLGQRLEEARTMGEMLDMELQGIEFLTQVEKDLLAERIAERYGHPTRISTLPASHSEIDHAVQQQQSAHQVPPSTYSTFPPSGYYFAAREMGASRSRRPPPIDTESQLHQDSTHFLAPSLPALSHAKGAMEDRYFTDDDYLNPFGISYASLAGMEIPSQHIPNGESNNRTISTVPQPVPEHVRSNSYHGNLVHEDEKLRVSNDKDGDQSTEPLSHQLGLEPRSILDLALLSRNKDAVDLLLQQQIAGGSNDNTGGDTSKHLDSRLPPQAVDQAMIEIDDESQDHAGTTRGRSASNQSVLSGDDSDAIHRLRHLDEDLEYRASADIIDTEPFNGDVYKMLIGRIYEG